ncbi:MAG: glycoside hydrolase family 78 protein [Pirellulales bacterium]
MRQAAIMLAGAALFLLTPNWAAADIRVTDTRCEYLTNPLGIDATRPRLSWKLESGERGTRQTAYQVLVASSAGKLAANEGDLWNSGRVESSESSHIRYAGKPLSSTERAWWKVRVWDQDGRESAWSDTGTWEMALLSADDWHGKWIARNTDTGEQPLPIFRREFDVKGKVKRARAYITGLGYFELTVNGQKIGNHELDPGFTRYDRRVLYLTHDVTDALRDGKNALGVMLGNGWYNMQLKTAWNFDQAPWRAAPRLLAELRVEYEDGRVETIASDKSWKNFPGPITRNGIYGGETYDARREQPGWNEPGFDDAHWDAVEVVDSPSGKLTAQAMRAIEVERVLEPAKVTEPAPGVFLVDVGQNLAGVAELSIEGPAGTEVVMKYGEHLHPNGRLDQANIGNNVWEKGKEQPYQTDTYILKGDGRETWHARFVYHGFRYVEVTGAPGKLTTDNLRIRWMHSAVPRVGEFACSNPLINTIDTAANWSYLSNLQGIPTDCPHREKNGWTGDAQIACEFGLLNYDGVTVYEKWIQDLADEQRPDGNLPGIVPTGGWGYAWGNGPAWDSAFILIPRYVYEYLGDSSLLDKHYEQHRRYVDFLTAHSKEGIVEIGLGDWLSWKTDTSASVTSTAYYYVDTLIVAETARRLGLVEDAERYEKLAVSIRAAFNREFYDAATASYANGSQAALSCALYQGLAEPGDRPAVLKSLETVIAKNDDHVDCGILGAKYMMNVLSAEGRTDLAYKIAAQETQPGWGWWFSQGATTLWEAWKQEGSNNHIMFGDVAAWFTKNLAGIQPDLDSPGFTHFLLKPQPVGDLTWAKASYNSIRGKIACDWKLADGQLAVDVVVPANTTVTLWLPTKDPDSVREGGQSLAAAKGVEISGSERNVVRLKLGSGNYRFTAAFDK